MHSVRYVPSSPVTSFVVFSNDTGLTCRVWTQLLGIVLVALVFFRNGLATGIIFAIPAWENVNGVRNMFVGIICLTAFIDCSYIGMYIWGKQLRRACTKRYLAYVEASR